MKINFMNQMTPIQRDKVLKRLLIELAEEDKKQMKEFVMPGYFQEKLKFKSLHQLRWRNAMATWKHFKVFKVTDEQDLWFIDLPSLSSAVKKLFSA